jgi:hypothetical protein
MERREPVLCGEKHIIFAHFQPYTFEQELLIMEANHTEFKALAERFGRTIWAIKEKKYFLLNPTAREGVKHDVPVIESNFCVPTENKEVKNKNRSRIPSGNGSRGIV